MLGQLLLPEIRNLIEERELKELRHIIEDWEETDIAELIQSLDEEEGVIIFRVLPRDMATRVFEYLRTDQQQAIIDALASREHRLAELLNDLSPDDRTALLEELPGPVAQKMITLLRPDERRIALMLLGYPEDSVGRLMTPDYVAVRPTWTIEQAISHIRRYGKDSETLNVIYVVDDKWHLIDEITIREILLAEPDLRIGELLKAHVVSLKATDDQERAVALFRDYDRVALPVTDSHGVLLGIVTVDDVLDVAEEEATEDIQMIGGMEALDDPYIETPLPELVKKRARWLTVLFFGEMLTATAMAYFEDEIQRAVVLALFLPLIISSGGNSGSQAATLIIRALAIGELKVKDWWMVMRREILSGLWLGGILGLIGFVRVAIWQSIFESYGVHWMLIAFTVGFSLVGVVIFGTLAGSMLPFIMKRVGADPAASSAPFVATLVDVTGVIIYFIFALLFLTGTLL